MSYLTDRQLAERLGVSRPTIWRWNREVDDFPKAVKLGPACTRWRLAEIEAWEAAREIAA